jgi:hypothetical protein
METIIDVIQNEEILKQYLFELTKDEYLKYTSINGALIDLYSYFKSINNLDKAMFYINQVNDNDLKNEILKQDIF